MNAALGLQCGQADAEGDKNVNAEIDPVGEVRTLHVNGMTCASCVAHVERALMKVDGVRAASVNLATAAATVVVAPGIANAVLEDAVAKAGYAVVRDELSLEIEGMSCAACVGRVEKVLRRVPGVADASVNLATRRASVSTLGVAADAALTQALVQADRKSVV